MVTLGGWRFGKKQKRRFSLTKTVVWVYKSSFCQKIAFWDRVQQKKRKNLKLDKNSALEIFQFLGTEKFSTLRVILEF